MFVFDSICNCLCGKRKVHQGCSWRYKIVEDLPGEVCCSLRDSRFRRIQVSSKGRVRHRDGRVTVGFKLQGYLNTGIGLQKHRVHRLVCLAFLGNAPTPYHTVDHIDRCKTNNDVINLRGATMSEQAVNRCNSRLPLPAGGSTGQCNSGAAVGPVSGGRV